MGSQFLRVQWCGFFFLLFFAVSCTLNLELKKPKGEEEFFQETSRLEKLAREDPATSVRAKSHLQLAFLYVNSQNPQLNYSRALQEMENYLSMSPAKAQKDDFRNWLAVLREMEQLRKDRIRMGKEYQDLQTQIEKLQARLEWEMEQLHKDKIRMGKEYQDLQTQIEKLQARLEKVREANINLRNAVASLKEINERMQKTIETLENLDLQMEEKRSLIK